MKKVLTVIAFIISMNAAAQKDDKKKDSVVVITITREEVNNLIKVIDANVDSKRTSKEIVDFLLSRAVLAPKKEK